MGSGAYVLLSILFSKVLRTITIEELCDAKHDRKCLKAENIICICVLS